MAPLLALRPAGRQQVGREEPLRKVIDPPAAGAPGESKDAGLSEGFEDRSDLVGGAPVPVDRRTGLDVGGRQRPVRANPPEQLLDQGRVLLKGAAAVNRLGQVPGDPVPGELSSGEDREPIIVRLEKDSILVQEPIRPGALVASDPGGKGEVVIAAGHIQRVELERAEALDHAHHARGLGWQVARRRQQVAEHEVAAGDVARDGVRSGSGGGLGHTRIVAIQRARAGARPACPRSGARPAGPRPACLADADRNAGARQRLSSRPTSEPGPLLMPARNATQTFPSQAPCSCLPEMQHGSGGRQVGWQTLCSLPRPCMAGPGSACRDAGHDRCSRPRLALHLGAE